MYSSASSRMPSRATSQQPSSPIAKRSPPAASSRRLHVYEKLGKYDQAVAAYQQIKDKYYTSPEAESVEADLIRARAAGGK